MFTMSIKDILKMSHENTDLPELTHHLSTIRGQTAQEFCSLVMTGMLGPNFEWLTVDEVVYAVSDMCQEKSELITREVYFLYYSYPVFKQLNGMELDDSKDGLDERYPDEIAEIKKLSDEVKEVIRAGMLRDLQFESIN